MGESGSLSLVHTTRRRALARAVTSVMERLGFMPDPRGDLDVLLVPGKGWTAIVCADPEVLCERPPGDTKPALAHVAETIARSAFQISVHDGDSITLLEATPKGRVVASGGEGSNASPFFHAERIDEGRFFAPRFYAIPVKGHLRAIADGPLFHDDLLTTLVPCVEPFSLLRGEVIDNRRLVPKGSLRMSFATTVKRSSRPPRPFRFWKGIFKFPSGEPCMEGDTFAREPMGTVDEVKRALTRHFGPLIGSMTDVGGVPVELEVFPQGGDVVEQIDVKVIATDEGMPTNVALRLAALAAEKGWTVLDWN
jgi:hypothetical protein